VLHAAAREADLIVWDGGNNDFPFVRAALHVVVADALRPGHATTYHPGETVLRMADVVVVNKVDAASPEDTARVVAEIRDVNPRVPVVRAASPVRLADAGAVRGRRALVVEDAPTITHGGMPFGAGLVAARAAGAAAIVDPRRSAVGPVRELFARQPHIGPVLPTLGYAPAQLAALAATIDGSDADVVVAATPMDLAALTPLRKPVVRARYQFAEMDDPGLGGIVDAFHARLGARCRTVRSSSSGWEGTR
jgi:predicted GTPase